MHVPFVDSMLSINPCERILVIWCSLKSKYEIVLCTISDVKEEVVTWWWLSILMDLIKMLMVFFNDVIKMLTFIMKSPRREGKSMLVCHSIKRGSFLKISWYFEVVNLIKIEESENSDWISKFMDKSGAKHLEPNTSLRPKKSKNSFSNYISI